MTATAATKTRWAPTEEGVGSGSPPMKAVTETAAVAVTPAGFHQPRRNCVEYT